MLTLHKVRLNNIDVVNRPAVKFSIDEVKDETSDIGDYDNRFIELLPSSAA